MDLKFLKKFKVRKSLKREGVLMETQYILHLNNDEPRYFTSKKDLVEFLNLYSKSNTIFALHTYRIDCYSLM